MQGVSRLVEFMTGDPFEAMKDITLGNAVSRYPKEFMTSDPLNLNSAYGKSASMTPPPEYAGEVSTPEGDEERFHTTSIRELVNLIRELRDGDTIVINRVK